MELNSRGPTMVNKILNKLLTLISSLLGGNKLVSELENVDKVKF